MVLEVTYDDLIDRYETLLLDAYGVLVDGSGAIEGAPELIRSLNRRGKPYYVVTNDASRLPETSSKFYRGVGLDIHADRIVTSGSLLIDYFDRRDLAGSRCLVLGTEDSARYVSNAGGRVVEIDGSPRFDLLVLCDEHGYPFLESIDAVITALLVRLDAGDPVRLVLPNPDLIYPVGPDAFGLAIGGVAEMLERIIEARYPQRADLRFERLGKPFAAIFEEAIRRAGTRNVVMVGDQLSTDIRGASEFGIDSALVETGLTRRKQDWGSAELRPSYLVRP
jgi:HAD superfamily hydrolase (TIGR01450 family)